MNRAEALAFVEVLKGRQEWCQDICDLRNQLDDLEAYLKQGGAA